MNVFFKISKICEEINVKKNYLWRNERFKKSVKKWTFKKKKESVEKWTYKNKKIYVEKWKLKNKKYVEKWTVFFKYQKYVKKWTFKKKIMWRNERLKIKKYMWRNERFNKQWQMSPSAVS